MVRELCAASEGKISISVHLGRLRFGVALLGVVILEYAGAKLLGISGSGLFVPLCQRVVMAAWPGQLGRLNLPTTDLTHIDATQLQQFWQTPWAVCFCVVGERPRWLFCDEVSREAFAWCSREANLALRMPSAGSTSL